MKKAERVRNFCGPFLFRHSLKIKTDPVSLAFSAWKNISVSCQSKYIILVPDHVTIPAHMLFAKEFAKFSDVSNPDGYKGWFCKFIQHRDINTFTVSRETFFFGLAIVFPPN